MNQSVTLEKVDNGYIVRESANGLNCAPTGYYQPPPVLVFVKLEDALTHIKKKLG